VDDNRGKKWQIIVKEKYGSVSTVIFDSKQVYGELNRPARAVELLEDWLRLQGSFNYEGHFVRVLDKMLARPLVFRKDKKLVITDINS
jgi:hypothetical protein